MSVQAVPMPPEVGGPLATSLILLGLALVLVGTSMAAWSWFRLFENRRTP